MILRHQKHQIGKGSRQIYGILFDGAWLWEEYINSLIEDVFYHPMTRVVKVRNGSLRGMWVSFILISSAATARSV